MFGIYVGHALVRPPRVPQVDGGEILLRNVSNLANQLGFQAHVFLGIGSKLSGDGQRAHSTVTSILWHLFLRKVENDRACRHNVISKLDPLSLQPQEDLSYVLWNLSESG